MNRITKGLLNYMQAQLKVAVWEGEIPRYDTVGNAINPDITVSPSVWPVVRALTTEEGFERGWNCGVDPYDDRGPVKIEIYGVTRDSVENVMDNIETLLASETGWVNILANQGPMGNPSFVYDMRLDRWSCVQVEGERLANSQLYYKAVMDYFVGMHGIVSTF